MRLGVTKPSYFLWTSFPGGMAKGELPKVGLLGGQPLGVLAGDWLQALLSGIREVEKPRGTWRTSAPPASESVTKLLDMANRQ